MIICNSSIRNEVIEAEGVKEMESYNLTEAKAKLSSIINHVVFAKE